MEAVPLTSFNKLCYPLHPMTTVKESIAVSTPLPISVRERLVQEHQEAAMVIVEDRWSVRMAGDGFYMVLLALVYEDVQPLTILYLLVLQAMWTGSNSIQVMTEFQSIKLVPRFQSSVFLLSGG